MKERERKKRREKNLRVEWRREVTPDFFANCG